MNAFENPAVTAFISFVKSGRAFAQIWIQPRANGFELRHIQDCESPSEKLRSLSENEIRETAQFTATGAFRPLKSAPNLRGGWRFETSQSDALEFALNTFYPGAIADWFAVNFRSAQPTHYREFTARQTGMYRITAMLTDEQAAPMIRACCHKKFCLKQRRWTVNGVAPDAPEEKSLIPCLEPCAILLEFSRKAMRLEQAVARGEKVEMPTPDESDSQIREADFENPNNPRRLQLTLEKEKQTPNVVSV